ncbi:hypothetical protein L210DRAFT_3557146 [Boletus edulis BED1]|uniref:Uncharacterized protein n=1 Tax=Boletus edulis BED1 TaxID=1328754 RepID=A0AAD4G649_BOLED|nr:hypothetical protein L210DRAFT_3582107 [Boletus edulis BED1]KAF8432950.1 hypothetical protein L210DRAFT_3557146 [Boletus edulis BED1]
MHFNTFALLLPTLFVTSGVLAQETAVATSGTPDVTYPADDAFVFCSAQDCTGTCEVVDTANVPRDDGEAAPNDMGYQSIYWYDPGNYRWTLYTCVDYYNCASEATIGPNTCYNLYDNGVATDFYLYWYLVDGTG